MYNQLLREDVKYYRDLGYEFKVDEYGYRVERNGKFVCAAGINNRDKQHWRHRRVNVHNYFQICCSIARQHEEKRNAENTRALASSGKC